MYLTLVYYESIIISMRVSKKSAPDRENSAFIRSGLGSISTEGREYLKNLAKSLVTIQNYPGAPVPESISQEIIRNETEEEW